MSNPTTKNPAPELSKKAQVTILLIGILLLGWGFIMLARQDLQAYYYGTATTGWESTMGRVITAGADPDPDRRGNRYVLVTYQYEVAGHPYTGTRELFGARVKFADRPSAAAYAQDHYPPGPVKVYYRSSDPAIAVLLPGLQGGWEWWVGAFVVPGCFIVLLLGAFVRLWVILRSGPANPGNTAAAGA